MHAAFKGVGRGGLVLECWNEELRLDEDDFSDAGLRAGSQRWSEVVACFRAQVQGVLMCAVVSGCLRQCGFLASVNLHSSIVLLRGRRKDERKNSGRVKRNNGEE